MTLSIAVFITSKLVSFLILLQGIEMYLVTQKSGFLEIWNVQNLRDDLEKGLPLPNRIISLVFSNKVFLFIPWFQIFFAGMSLIFMNPVLYLCLFILQLLISIRFRGTFNGGSDMMLFVLLTGLLISLLSVNESGQKLGLIYIAIHGLYSYFKAGLVKVVHREWRDGTAVLAFLNRSVFVDSHRFAMWLQNHRIISKLFSWFVLGFELSAMIMVFDPRLMPIYCVFAVLFHFVVYLFFGLNRFFWVWLSVWPAIIFSTQILIR